MRKTRSHWTKYLNWNRRDSLTWFWFAVFKQVKRDTRRVLKFPFWRWRSCTCTFFSGSFLFRTIVFAFFLFYRHWKILLYPLWNFEKNKRICIWNSLTHSHCGNPTSHGLFTGMGKKFKNKNKNYKIDQANINAWLGKKLLGLVTSNLSLATRLVSWKVSVEPWQHTKNYQSAKTNSHKKFVPHGTASFSLSSRAVLLSLPRKLGSCIPNSEFHYSRFHTVYVAY